MPIGILGSLAVATVLYILFGHVLTGVAPWQEFATAGKEASVSYAVQTYMKGYEWLGTSITVAILAGFSSVILVMLMGQSRVFFSMANDGLIPKAFSELHPKYQTPFKANWILFVFVGLFAGFAPGSLAGDLTSFVRVSGTLNQINELINSAGGLRITASQGRVISSNLVASYVELTGSDLSPAFCSKASNQQSITFRALGLQMDTVKTRVDFNKPSGK
jgi:amino acid transporter